MGTGAPAAAVCCPAAGSGEMGPVGISAPSPLPSPRLGCGIVIPLAIRRPATGSTATGLLAAVVRCSYCQQQNAHPTPTSTSEARRLRPLAVRRLSVTPEDQRCVRTALLPLPYRPGPLTSQDRTS